jgi:hypothetical protein
MTRGLILSEECTLRMFQNPTVKISGTVRWRNVTVSSSECVGFLFMKWYGN